MRFKVPIKPAPAEIILFQFQSGAIQSTELQKITLLLMLSFNSKVVRFKAVAILHRSKLSDSCFNSKVVRFKACFQIIRQKGRNMFQFQSGAIQRKSKSSRYSSVEEFQFQSGAIQSSQPCSGCNICFLFQFQSGAIQSFADYNVFTYP